MRGHCIFWMLILLSTGSLGSVCKTKSVKIESWKFFENGTILDRENDVKYKPEEYTKKDGNQTEYWGCLCDIKTCIRKCCPLSENLGILNKIYSCMSRKGEENFLVNVTDIETNRTYLVNRSGNFRWIYGINDDMFALEPENQPEDIYRINANDGKLVTPNFNGRNTYTFDEFCIDYYNQTMEYRVLIVNDMAVINESRKITGVLYPILMVLSLPPLLITFIVYATIAELRNLHGYCLLSYVTSLFFLYFTFTFAHTGIDWLHPRICYFIGFSGIMWFLSVFFWLNVMGFDICMTFSNIRPITGTMKEKEKKKFIFYSLYSWGCSFVFMIAAVVFEFTPNISPKVKPKIAEDRCWFANKDAELYFCYAPAATLMICNIIMLIITAYNLTKMNREMNVMKKAGARSKEEGRSQFILYGKLTIMMGINWALEVTSWAHANNDYYWYIPDIYNCLQGWIVFFIFVWMGKQRELAKKKFFPQKTGSKSQSGVARFKRKPEGETDTQKSTTCTNVNSASPLPENFKI